MFFSFFGVITYIYNPYIGGSKPSFFMGTWGSKVVGKWVISPTEKCDRLGL